MSHMFYNCSSLSSFPDISNWDTSNVTNMSEMFDKCLSLSSLPDISKWNTSNVYNMSYMFKNAHYYHVYLMFQNGILLKLLI